MNEFTIIIDDLISLFTEMINLEQSKFESIKNNRITHLQDCINKEQAAILKLRGLDKKREACQEKLGYKGYTFKEILSAIPDENRNEVQKQFNKLTRQIVQFRKVCESSSSLLAIRLHSIERNINQQNYKMNQKKSQWEVTL